MENNRQFELMRFAARQKLEGAGPVQLSVLTGLCWDGRTFDTETLGNPYSDQLAGMSDFSGTGDVARPDNFAVSGKYERNYAHGEIPCPERISLRRLGKGYQL